jgi:hypothetical protein
MPTETKIFITTAVLCFGNAVSAEVADLAAGLRAHVLAHAGSAVVRPCSH